VIYFLDERNGGFIQALEYWNSGMMEKDNEIPAEDEQDEKISCLVTQYSSIPISHHS
jgi:hypothetical protein